jgi:hypothetical protein
VNFWKGGKIIGKEYLMDFKLQAGDVFCTSNPQSLGKAIRFIESTRSADEKAEYSHAGIIIDANGKTLEAIWHIESQMLWDAYKGEKVLIARWSGMTPEAFQKGYDVVKSEIGMTYPYYRLLLSLFGLARIIHFKGTVCSELAQRFLINAGVITLSGQNYWGVTPDDLADEWKISKYFSIVFEGII